jgi:hypothetical protein
LKASKNDNASLLYAGIFSFLFLTPFVFAENTLSVEPAALEAIGLRDVVEQDPNLTGLGVRIAAV